ncbi:MAG: hypothetical protein ACOX6I_03470 [Syntrophomonadaceae bacterium]|jgi:hypothetical protein
MKRPFAYICSPFKGDEAHNTEKAREYCRKAYEVGFTPICPHLLFPQFLDESIPEERKAGMEMASALLRRCHVLLVCGNTVSEGMMCEILYAHRLNITATTLDGILAVKEQRKTSAAASEQTTC